MTAIVQPQAVLIAPGEDDPRGLRAPGAPIVQRRNQLGWQTGWTVAAEMVAWDTGTFNVPWPGYGPVYLRVAWDEVVPEGVDRLARVMGVGSPIVERWVNIALRASERTLRERLARFSFGLLVLDERTTNVAAERPGGDG